MSPEEKQVLDAALAVVDSTSFAPEWPTWSSMHKLQAAVRAYRKSLEPRERYSIERDRANGGWRILQTLPGNGFETVGHCFTSSYAERIAALLNKEEGSER